MTPQKTVVDLKSENIVITVLKWLFTQQPGLVVALLFSAFYLFIDRPELKAELRECHKSYNELQQYIINEYGGIIQENSAQSREVNRTVRLYFHNVTEPD